MEFTVLPPEVTSALIHSGPGAESLIEASAAWQRLGTNLEETAGVYAGALAPLTAIWQGPSSAAMAQAVQPYLAWLRTTAQRCQQTAASVQDAIAAFGSVRAAVVPVAAVAANRTRLAQLLATNRFGSNLPAIARTEDEYQDMWANNSAAMSRYEASSAQATTVTLFSSPPQIADPAAATTQSSAVQTAAAAAAPAAASPIDSLISSIESFDPNSGWFGLANTYANQFVSSGFPINMLSYVAQASSAQALQSVGGDIGEGLSEGMQSVGGAAASGANGLSALGSAGLSAEPTAAIGVGVSVGKLTAPPAVVGLLPSSQGPIQLASAATPITAEDASFPIPPLMPPPISAGSGWRRRKQAKYDDISIGKELKGTVMPRPPSAG
jgi:PPE-repeat protein